MLLQLFKLLFYVKTFLDTICTAHLGIRNSRLHDIMKNKRNVGTHCHIENEHSHSKVVADEVEVMSTPKINILVGPTFTVHAVFSVGTIWEW
jgi:hypothetical protein